MLIWWEWYKTERAGGSEEEREKTKTQVLLAVDLSNFLYVPEKAIVH